MMQFVLAIVSRYSSTLVQFLISIIVANHLPASDAGVYFMIFGVVTACSMAAGFGAPDGAVQLIPSLRLAGKLEDASRMLHAILRFGAITGLAGGFLLALSYWLLTSDLAAALLSGLRLAGYSLNFTASQCLVAYGRSQFGRFAYYGIINWVTIIVIGVYLALPFKVSLIGMLAAAGIGSSLGALITVSALPLSVFRGIPGRNFPGAALQTGIPIAATRVAQTLLIWSPVWIAGIVFSASDAAVVGVASRLVMAAGSAIAAVRFSVRAQVVEFAVANRWSELELLGKKIAKPATALCIVAAVATLAVGPYVFPLIFGKGYHELWWVTAILLFGVLVESMAGPADEALKLLGGSRFMLVLQIVVLIGGSFAQYVAALVVGLWAQLLISSISFGMMYIGIVSRFVQNFGVNPSIVPVRQKFRRDQRM